MLRTPILHPQILGALGAAGHGSLVVISDSNYPHSTGAHPAAERVFLNFAPGLLKVTDVLDGLVKTIPIEKAEAMVPADGSEPPIFPEIRALLPDELKLASIGRFPFYEKARSADTALIIATGEQRTYACMILTIGVIQPS